MTCSFGIAQRDADMKSGPDLCEAADRALYASKRAGRNLVTGAIPKVG